MFRQIDSILLAVVYFSIHGPAAYALEQSFWAQRRQRAGERNTTAAVCSVPAVGPAGFSSFATKDDLLSAPVAEKMPPAVLQNHRDLLAVLAQSPGTVRNVSVPAVLTLSTPMVIHVQDVHGNEQAQRRIGETIDSLVSLGLVDVVGLEGASGAIAVQQFRDYPNREAVRRAADYLLGERKISGPVYAAFTGNGPCPSMVGVEDPALYWANVAAYRAAAPVQEKTRARLARERASIEIQKKSVYSPSLITFDQSVQAYADRRLSLGDFVNNLPVAAGYPTLARFRETVALEKGLNFSVVEAERAHLISELGRRLPASELNGLIAEASSFRAGRVRASVFYKRLKEKAQRAGLFGNPTTALNNYFRYVELADRIDPERLMDELAWAEKEVYRSLAQTPAQQNLMERSRRLMLAERLADFVLTPSEWDEYQTVFHKRPPAFLKDFEDFYKHAQSRDRFMSERVLGLLKKGGESPPRVVVLVTGGFHARGMADQLTRAGTTVVSFVPRLETIEVDKGSASLGLFTQEKTPLENLFQKERLFLAPPPVSPTILKTILPALVAAVILYGGGSALGMDVQVLYQALGGVGVLAVGKLLGDLVELKVIKKRGSASLRVSIKPDGTITGLTERGDHAINPLEQIKQWWATIHLPLPQFVLSPILATASNSDSPGVGAFPPSTLPAGSKGPPLRNETSQDVPDDLMELHQMLREFLLAVSSTRGKTSGVSYIDPIHALVRKASDISLPLRVFYENKLIDSSFDTPQLMDLLVRTLYIPAGFCISKDLNKHELLRVNSISRSDYLGQEIWLMDVSNLDGTSTGSVNPALNVPAGYVLVDSSSLKYAVDEVLKKNKGLPLTREELLRVELEFSIQTYLAKAAQEAFLSNKEDVPMHAVSGLTIVPAIVRPGGWADYYLRKAVNQNPAGAQSPTYIPPAFVELFIFSNRLEGMINALENLALAMGEEKAHAVGIHKLMEIADQGNIKSARREPLISRPEAFGSKLFTDQIMSAVVDARRRRKAPVNSDLWRSHLKKELTSESLGNYPALVDLLKKIQRENFLTPFERFVEVAGYPPAPSEVHPHIENMPIRESSVREVGPPVVFRRRKGGTPSLLLRKWMNIVRHREEGARAHYSEDVERLVRDLRDVLARENTLSLVELVALSEGPRGLRTRVIHHGDVEEVVELSMLIEHLRVTIADREAIEKINEGQSLVEKAEFEQAILSYLEIYKEENRMGNMSEEVSSNLKGLLESARALFVSSNRQPVIALGDVLDKADVFGLAQDEIEFLTRLSKSDGDMKRETLPFDGWGLSQLRNKLGKHTPNVLLQLAEGLGDQTEASPISMRSPVVLAGEFDVLVDKDIDNNLKMTQMGNALVRIDDLIQKAVSRREGRLEKLDFSFAKAYLGHEYPNVLRLRLTSSLRVYFRVFEESYGNVKRKTVVIAAIVNKGNTSEDGGLGAIDPQLGEKLKGYSEIGNLGSEALRNKTEPLTVNSKGSPASLADEWAWKMWGGDPQGYNSYILYTFFGAPAWEWVYQVLPLNLWAQRGGANWILRRFFGKEDNDPVVVNVPGQTVVTLFGLGSLGIGLWVGTVLPVLLGALSYSLASAFIFSGAHQEKTPEQKRFLFWLGFGLALVFIGPSLGLFLWDPVWLTGFENLFYLGSLGAGWIFSFAGHVGAQWINLHMKAKTTNAVTAGIDLNGSDLWGKLLAIEESLAMGDSGKAQEIWVEIREGVESIDSSTVEGQWIASLQERLGDARRDHGTTTLNPAALSFKEMEYAFFGARDFTGLFRMRELIHEFEMTEEQRDLLKMWDEIIHVVRLFTLGQWEEADRQAALLETTARLFVRDHGIFRPYQERLMFGFLRDYRVQRGISHAPQIQQTLGELSELKGGPINNLGEIIHQVARLNDGLNDYEKAALNVHAEHLKTVGHGALIVRLPEFVFGVERPGLAVYNPLLVQALNLIPDGAKLTDFSEAIQRYIGNQQRDDFMDNLSELGVNSTDGVLLSDFLSSENARDFGPGGFRGMHAVGGAMGRKEWDSLAARAGDEANLAIRHAWASAIEASLARRERERILERVGLSQTLRELVALLRMPSPSIRMYGAQIPVRFQLLPGDWDPWSPAPRAGVYNIKDDAHVGGGESLTMVVALHENDLAAVLHEGVELLLSFRPNARYYQGPAHPYGFLAEILANDPAFGDEVPQRAYQELGRMSLGRLLRFSAHSSANDLEIAARFQGRPLMVMRRHLLKVNDTLFDFALAMQQERLADSLGSLSADLVEMEKFIAVGNVPKADESKARAVRRLYHLRKNHPTGLRFQQAVLKELDQRLENMKFQLSGMGDIQTLTSRDLSVRLESMADQLFGFDLVGLRNSILDLERFKFPGNLPEQTAAMELWWGIWSVLKPVIENDDWDRADLKFARFERKLRQNWKRWGVGRMYLESVGFGFIDRYRSQRDAVLNRRVPHPYQIARDKLREAAQKTHILTHEEVVELGRALISASGDSPNPFQRESLRFIVARLGGRITDATRENWSQLIKRENGLQNATRDSASPHSSFLFSMMLMSPGSEMKISGLNNLGALYRQSAMTRHNVIFYLWRNGMNILSSDAWIAFMDELRGPPVSEQTNGMLRRIFSQQAGIALVQVHVAVFSVLAVVLVGAVFVKGWMLLALAATGLVAGGLAGRAMGTSHPLDLDVAGKDLVAGFSLTRWNLATKQAQGSDAKVGDRPLTILYLDKTVVANMPSLIQRYSVSEDGAGLALVPVDDAAQSYVADLPDTFNGLVFESGQDLFGRLRSGAPDLADVERRLENAGVHFSDYTGCRVVAPVGMAINAEGVRSDLFKEALVILLNGLIGLVIKRKDLHSIDRAARAVVSAA